MRDPVARFRSALFEHSRNFFDFPHLIVMMRFLLRLAYSLIDVLENTDFPYPEKYEHFTPQHSYIEVGGVCDKHIGLWETLGKLMNFLLRAG